MPPKRGTGDNPASLDDDASSDGSAPSLSVSFLPRPRPAPLSILVPPSLTPSELSQCLSQLFASDLSATDFASVHGLWDAGGSYLPLSHVIASAADLAGAALTVQPASKLPKAPKPSSSPFADPKVLGGAAAFLLLLLATGLLQSLLAWLSSVPLTLLDVLIEAPLKHLYRNGPATVGWEGLGFPQICARITYHGDAGFWAQNLPECKKIFFAKEAAAMSLVRPLA
ncbi:hypothetical protein TeGR_g2603, partial [Tetraparma gracilis]